MSEPTFTPGPWEADGADVIATKPFRQILVDYNRTVAANFTRDEAAANARLIAAAPEMYAALTDIFAMMDEGYLVRNTSDDAKPGWAMKQLPFIKRLQTAHAALAKARGETP